MAVKNDPAIMNLKSKYEFVNCGNLSLETILQKVWDELISSGFTPLTMRKEKSVFNRFRRLAEKLGVSSYTEELRSSFLNDAYYGKNHRFSKTRYELHRIFIHRIDSFLANGKIDFSPIRKEAFHMNNSLPAFIEAYSIYRSSIGHLSESTRILYLGIVGYFLDYLAFDKKYTSLNDIKKGDVSSFIPKIVSEHYPNSLASVISGLRGFLNNDSFDISKYSYELPNKLPKKKRILTPLSEDELSKIENTLDKEKSISFRDRAISEIAIGTGYRSVDILNMTFSSFDWENDRLNIVQKKTGKCLQYPMTASIGNAVVDYLLNERPESESDYIFLNTSSPHYPLKTHSGCRIILKKVLEKADINIGNRPSGTRLTRHSRATFLLNRGIPLATIAQSLGHSNELSVQIYLTTDRKKMAECILPLPGRKVVSNES